MTTQVPLPFDPERGRREAFERFHAEHPFVWEMFERFTLSARDACGSDRIGARMVWERIRWETRVAMRIAGETPKMNDHLVPFYARMFMEKHPELGRVFETRTIIEEEMEAPDARCP